jgi:hypothetical protein
MGETRPFPLGVRDDLLERVMIEPCYFLSDAARAYKIDTEAIALNVEQEAIAKGVS